MSTPKMLTPEVLVENAFAQAAAVSQNIATDLATFWHLSDWADTDYAEHEEATENAVRALRLLEEWHETNTPQWSEVLAQLVVADSRLHTVAELRTPILEQWDKVRAHLDGYRPVLDASAVVGGRRGMYAWLAFQATLAARPAEVTAMTPGQRADRFSRTADQLIEQMGQGWSRDREAHDWWNIDGGSDPENEPRLRAEWEVESDVLLSALPNQFQDGTLPTSPVDQYLVARHLADCARHVPTGGEVTRVVGSEWRMVAEMLRLVADRPDRASSRSMTRLRGELNDLAVDLGRYQRHVEDTHGPGGVVSNLTLTTEQVRDIVEEQNRRRLTAEPGPRRDQPRLAPLRL
ncbi:hypothetical protein [Promicromonospora sp. NPDC023987]|uniref:hypothetical protein n=1 Tax=Promicromonospora sp. NPDC023987 TaxID=3155360 RepID=UPI0033C7B324